MKKILILFCGFFVLTACHGILGGKGRTIARIDGQAFTEEDLELRMNAVQPDDEQREAMLRDPEERRNNFENLLHNRLYALAAQKAGLANRDTLVRRLASIDQRVVSKYYFEVHIKERGGHTLKEIEAYYRANPDKFAEYSGRAVLLSRVISRISDSLILMHGNLDSFYQANRNNYLEKAHCNPSLIETRKLKDAQAAFEAIKAGMDFGAAAAKFSIDVSKSNQGRMGRVNKGEDFSGIGIASRVDSLLFNPATRLGSGQVSRPLPKNSNFVLIRPDSCVDDFIPPLDKIRSQVAGDFIRYYKSNLSGKAAAVLKAKYHVRIIPHYKVPTEEEIKAFYEQNKGDYESPETFELYHIETSKKDNLQARFKVLKDLNGFKALATKASENALTKPQGGYLGVVKRDYCLPYGVGMLPSLFPELDGLSQGKVIHPLQSPDTHKWHFFWLVKKEPRKLKPFERVRVLVKTDLEAFHATDYKPEDTLAVYGDGKVIRESDVIFLKDEIPPTMRIHFTRENEVDYLLTWQLATNEARALGLMDEKQLIAQRLYNEDGYWGRLYQDSVMVRSYEEDTSLLAKTFSENTWTISGNPTEHDWHKYARDIAAYLTLSPDDLKIEYYTNQERYMRDTVLPPMSAVVYNVFQSLKPAAYQRLDQKVLEKLKARLKVRIVDASLQEPSLEPAVETYKKAQNMHYEGKLDQALNLYYKLRQKFPDQAALQDSVCFGIAQIYSEQGQYQQALAEYRRASYLYPGSANDYKAMFMVGFIQSENLKNDSAAVRSFEKMLAKHPNTELSSDANWMIRNIRSGGKMMPKLE